MDRDGWPIEVPRGTPPQRDDSAHREGRPAEPKTVTLQPGAQYKYSVSVTQVVPPLKDDPSRKARPIGAGQYKASVMTMLIDPSHVENGTAVTRTIESSEFAVHLTF
jgi:hypothetical protein